MPFIFHSHTHRTSFKLNEGGGGGEGKIWVSNYVQRKAPTDMKFGLKMHYSATNILVYLRYSIYIIYILILTSVVWGIEVWLSVQ